MTTTSAEPVPLARRAKSPMPPLTTGALHLPVPGRLTGKGFDPFAKLPTLRTLSHACAGPPGCPICADPEAPEHTCLGCATCRAPEAAVYVAGDVSARRVQLEAALAWAAGSALPVKGLSADADLSLPLVERSGLKQALALVKGAPNAVLVTCESALVTAESGAIAALESRIRGLGGRLDLIPATIAGRA